MYRLLFVLFLQEIMSWSQAFTMFEGDHCILPDTRLGAGQCTIIHRCDYAKKLLKERKKPLICGFAADTPLVCCPVPNNIKDKEQETISELRCKGYHHLRNGGTFIAHGQQAGSKEFPHMAAIGYDDNEKTQWLCGGSLISEAFVLSAAHCAKSRHFGEAKWIRLGDLDLIRTDEDSQPRDSAINRTYVHPDYKTSFFYNDIALFRLQERLRFNLYIKPACLHTGKSHSKLELQAVGWGTTAYFGSTSSHLLKASLNLIQHNTCSRVYRNERRKLPNGIKARLQVCAGDVSGKDTCAGDSGGPLHYRVSATSDIKAHFVVFGITSFGKGCGEDNSVGVYTKVSAYISWIENIVWPGHA